MSISLNIFGVYLLKSFCKLDYFATERFFSQRSERNYVTSKSKKLLQKSFMRSTRDLRCLRFYMVVDQGALTEGEGSVQLTLY